MELQIQRGSSRCLACAQPFAHEQKHYSLLKIAGNDISREDYCEECWPKFLADNQNVPLYSHWETRYRDPAAARATPEAQFVPLLRLLYDSLTGGTREHEALCYVCALILRRQKVFRLVREEKDADSGKPVLVFHDRHNDVQLKIGDPNLTESEFQEVKQRLEGHLSQKDTKDTTDER